MGPRLPRHCEQLEISVSYQLSAVSFQPNKTFVILSGVLCREGPLHIIATGRMRTPHSHLPSDASLLSSRSRERSHRAAPLPSCSTQKELSPAHQPRRTAQKNRLAFRTYRLSAARGVDFNGRIRPPRRHRCRRGRATASARTLRFPSATLKKTRSQIMLAIDHNEFNVHTVLELRTALDFCRPCLPVRRKLRNEDDIVRIAHRYRNPSHFPAARLHREFLADHSFTHLNFKLVLPIAARSQSANLQSCSGLNRNLLFPLLRAQVCSDTAGAVAGNLGLRTIAVDQTDFDVRGTMRQHPLYAVRAQAFMAIADALRKNVNVCLAGSQGEIDQ